MQVTFEAVEPSAFSDVVQDVRDVGSTTRR